MISAIVLAGGDSSRIGTDKSMLTLGDKPLITWVTGALADLDELIISISNEFQATKYDLFIDVPHKFVVDKFQDLGALGGLLSAAGEAEGELVAVAPCDTPFISSDLYKLLVKHVEGFSGAAPKINGHWEPLTAVYNKGSLMEVLENMVKTENRRLGDICRSLEVKAVTEQEFSASHLDLDCLLNLNLPGDLDKAIKFIEEKKE